MGFPPFSLSVRFIAKAHSRAPQTTERKSFAVGRGKYAPKGPAGVRRGDGAPDTENGNRFDTVCAASCHKTQEKE